MAKRKGKQNNNKAPNGGWTWRKKTDLAGEQRIFGSLDAKIMMDADPLLQHGTQTRSQCLISSNPTTKTTRSFQMQARITWRDLQEVRR